MRRGYAAGGVILLVLAVLCIATTVTEVIRAEYRMGSWRFWSAVAFHFVTGAVALVLLGKAHRRQPPVGKETPA